MKLISYYTETHEILVNKFFIPSIKEEDNFLLKIKKGIQQSKDGNYFSEGFNITTRDKIQFLCDELKQSNENDFVLFSDVDIIFIKPINEYLKNYQQYDAVFQKGYNFLNTGFFMLKNTKKIRDFFNNAVNEIPKYHDDQVAINKMIVRSDIKYTTFDDRILNPAALIGKKVWAGEKFILPDNTLVFHACWCAGVENKIKMLEYARDYETITS
jgi:hypothetical protein